MASVTLENASKTYIPDIQALKSTSLQIRDSEFLVLVGPSGCGKTTILRLISGLEEATSGDIYIDSRRINDVAPKDRDIAMVFQNYALYPHMNVYDNMAFGLKLRKIPKPEIKRRVEETSRLLGLEAFLLRKPRELSGGQRQRVAMGRAIVREPKVFLMDEPLSNLDAQLRAAMRVQLQKLHRALGITTLYVTHDQTEAMTLGSRIAVMDKGLVQQIEAPVTLYEKPANLFVARFIGSPPMNVTKVAVTASTEGLILKGPHQINLVVPPEKKERLSPYQGREILVGIRPQDIRMDPNPALPAHMSVRIEAVELLGSEAYLHFNIGEEEWIAKVDPHLSISPGTEIKLSLDPARLHAFDPGTHQTLDY